MSMTVPVDTENPVRVCRKCAVQSQSGGEYCPHCGSSYARRRRSRKARLIVFGLPVVVLALAGAAGAAVVVHHDHQVAAHQRAVRAAHAAAERAAAHHAAVLAAQRQAAAAARKAAEAQRKLKQDLTRIQRASIVSSLQSSVKKDALQDVSTGVLDGPILKADCQPATQADQTATIANYSCLAVSSVGSDGTESGYRFSATINVNSGRYSWRLGGA
jgi:hypothetical protein